MPPESARGRLGCVTMGPPHARSVTSAAPAIMDPPHPLRGLPEVIARGLKDARDTDLNADLDEDRKADPNPDPNADLNRSLSRPERFTKALMT